MQYFLILVGAMSSMWLIAEIIENLKEDRRNGCCKECGECCYYCELVNAWLCPACSSWYGDKPHATDGPYAPRGPVPPPPPKGKSGIVRSGSCVLYRQQGELVMYNEQSGTAKRIKILASKRRQESKERIQKMVDSYD